MLSIVNEVSGLCGLPNELLLHILDRLSTSDLFSLTSTSHRFHALSLRLIHKRLTHAASLGAQILLLECYHPSAKLTAGQLFCTPLGTPGLSDALSHGGDSPIGKLAHLGSLYSRFRPQRKEPDRVTVQRIRPGDIPGSRTHPVTALNGPNSLSPTSGPIPSSFLVAETVSIDAHELFSQLCCVTNLVSVGPRRGLFLSVVEIGDGTIRVWREWLAAQSKSQSSTTIQSEVEETQSHGVDLADDPSILWVSNRQNAVGIKFHVEERRMRQNNPILYNVEDENELPVSYYVEFEELLIKNTLLLRTMEESVVQQNSISGKAVVFGNFR